MIDQLLVAANSPHAEFFVAGLMVGALITAYVFATVKDIQRIRRNRAGGAGGK